MKARRTIFLSSADRVRGVGGSNYDFCIDLENTVSQMGPEFNAKNKNVKISMSVSKLYVPFTKGSAGVVMRDPPYYRGSINNNTRHVPQIKLLRLHTNMIHDNMISSGHSDIILQIPFAEHYKEALKDSPYTFSHVSYTERHSEHTGRFELLHGLDSLSCVRFWLTDEGNRFTPAFKGSDVYITLTLYAESVEEKVSHRSDLSRYMRELIHLNRLLLIQGEGPDRARAALEEHHRRNSKRARLT